MSLSELFAGQARFAQPTSPLMASLSLAMARVIAAPEIRESYEALARQVASANPHEPALRLAAALHEWVLLNDERTAEIRHYYASVADTRPVDDLAVRRFASVFRDHFTELCAAAATIAIQTNETSRGLVWMLPTSMVSGFERFHLVELGGSAGLNLMADHRRYQLEFEADHRLVLGNGRGNDLTVAVRGDIRGLDPLKPGQPASRWCIDRAPLDPTQPDVARRLLACVWGDQEHRIAALRRGLALTAQGPSIRRKTAEFPGQLAAAFAELPQDRPLVVFHTYVRAYLGPERAQAFDAALDSVLSSWPMPTLYAAFEPESDTNPICTWRVQSRGGAVELGRAHPHMSWVEFAQDALQTLRADST